MKNNDVTIKIGELGWQDYLAKVVVSTNKKYDVSNLFIPEIVASLILQLIFSGIKISAKLTL